MDGTFVNQVKQCIEEKLRGGGQNEIRFIIYPFGDIGMRIKYILNHAYGIQEDYIIDNHLCMFNPAMKDVSFLDFIHCDDYYLILASVNSDVYDDLKRSVTKWFQDDRIIELPSMRAGNNQESENWKTEIGRHSYGPLCRNHPFIASIGSFCSFAPGTDVVFNHEMRYITTSPIIYRGASEGEFIEFEQFRDLPYYIDGIQPHRDKLERAQKIKIGNDVWLGQNVIITNYSNIGNGVIAGAGAVITKDAPDYAILAGVPARIIGYRYSREEIACLNRISWWDWTDEEIAERYDDLYLPVQEFIKKYA